MEPSLPSLSVRSGKKLTRNHADYAYILHVVVSCPTGEQNLGKSYVSLTSTATFVIISVNNREIRQVLSTLIPAHVGQSAYLPSSSALRVQQQSVPCFGREEEKGALVQGWPGTQHNDSRHNPRVDQDLPDSQLRTRSSLTANPGGENFLAIIHGSWRSLSRHSLFGCSFAGPQDKRAPSRKDCKASGPNWTAAIQYPSSGHLA